MSLYVEYWIINENNLVDKFKPTVNQAFYPIFSKRNDWAAKADQVPRLLNFWVSIQWLEANFLSLGPWFSLGSHGLIVEKDFRPLSITCLYKIISRNSLKGKEMLVVKGWRN